MITDPYGLSRVLDEPGVMPQQARRLDPSRTLRPGEILVDVETLAIDAASFRQLAEDSHYDAATLGRRVANIVRERGKMHNPVTGSGGMLIGTVLEVSGSHPDAARLPTGTRIASLVSLTLTPLQLDAIRGVDLNADRVDVRGHAILFASGAYTVLPSDLPGSIVLAALDVCGAPALVARYARPGMRVAVIGAGKSGALCLAQARRSVGSDGSLVAIDVSVSALDALRNAALCDIALRVDATQSVDVLQAISTATRGQLCDLVVNCASVANTEMATILSTRDRGTALFFSMTTNFAAATLGAEGVSRDIQLIMGNGYSAGHAELTLGLLRSHSALRTLFEARYLRTGTSI